MKAWQFLRKSCLHTNSLKTNKSGKKMNRSSKVRFESQLLKSRVEWDIRGVNAPLWATNLLIWIIQRMDSSDIRCIFYFCLFPWFHCLKPKGCAIKKRHRHYYWKIRSYCTIFHWNILQRSQTVCLGISIPSQRAVERKLRRIVDRKLGSKIVDVDVLLEVHEEGQQRNVRG